MINNKESVIKVKVNQETLEGLLFIPKEAQALVLFAHGSGSSRFSPRNNFVAQTLHKKNIATLLIDLLTEAEDEIYENRFNINLLAERLLAITYWLKKRVKTKNLTLGYFGASTGAAAALKAAASLKNSVEAIVLRGGRPDLAEEDLDRIRVPTLLIVGGSDYVVLDLNKDAYEKLKSIKKLEIIPEATHLFEEPGALEKVAELATEWFDTYL